MKRPLTAVVLAVAFLIVWFSILPAVACIACGSAPQQAGGFLAGGSLPVPESRQWGPERAVVAPARHVASRPVSRPIAHAPSSVSGNVALGQQMAAKRGWTGSQWDALYHLWSNESGWSTSNYGPRLKQGSACGIPQKYPCGGLDGLSAEGQIAWGLDYIAGRYGTPASAYGHFLSHNWY